MFIRNAAILAILSLVVQSTLSFAGEDVYISEKTIDLKATRKMEDRGLNFAREAIIWADTYLGKKTEVKIRKDELDKLVEKKKSLAIAIQRLQIGLRRKKAKYARNPELLKVSVRQYSQDIEDMQYELAEIEKQIPALESKLARVTIKVEAEELKRGINRNKKETGGFDEEFEEEIQKRFERGKSLINIGSLSTSRFRH